MEIPILIVDETGAFKKLIVSDELLLSLIKMMRIDGETDIHALGEDGKPKVYKAKALMMTAKGCKGRIMFMQEEVQ